MKAPETSSDPLAIRHGLQLYRQGQSIEKKLDRLLALLGASEAAEADEPENSPPDPVQTILEALERVLSTQESQASAIQALDRKLSRMLERLPAAGR